MVHPSREEEEVKNLFTPCSVNKDLIMSTIEPSIFKSIFKPDENGNKIPEPKHPEPQPGTSKTPHNFTPRETPKTAQQQELSRTVYSYVARLRVLLLAWQKNRSESFKISKAIYALNVPHYGADHFPHELQPLIDSLIVIMGDMGDIFEEVAEFESRLQALSILQPSNDPVLTTWSVKMVAEKFNTLCEVLKSEHKLLEKVIENVAHEQNELTRLLYAYSLAPTPYVATQSAFLFSEAGLTFV